MIRALLARVRRNGMVMALLAAVAFAAVHGAHGTPYGTAPGAQAVALAAHGETGHRHGPPQGGASAHHQHAAATLCCPPPPDPEPLARPLTRGASVPPTAVATARGLRPAPQTPPPRAA